MVSRWLALKILGELWPEGSVLEVGMYTVLFSLTNHHSLKIMRSVRANVSPCHSPQHPCHLRQDLRTPLIDGWGRIGGRSRGLRAKGQAAD